MNSEESTSTTSTTSTSSEEDLNTTYILDLSGFCYGFFDLIRFIHLAFSFVILFNLPPLVNVHENVMKNWAIFLVVHQILNILLRLHSRLKSRYHRLVLEHWFYRLVKVAIYVTNHILGAVILIWGFQQIKPSLPVTNIGLSRGQEVAAWFSEYLIIYMLVMYIISYTILLCCGCCFGLIVCAEGIIGTDEQDPASTETIAGHSIVKKFSEFLGIDYPNCQICADEYKVDDSVRKLECGHFFHRDCVDEWLKRSKTCPICRQPIDSAKDLRKPTPSGANNV